MIARFRGRTLVLLACAAAGCEAPPGEGLSSLVDLSRLPNVVLNETLRLGGPEASGPSAFSRVPPIAVDADGSLYALERSANEVRHFGIDGTFLGAVGREGEGPGELTSAGRIGFVEDTLWVRNVSPPFVALFDRTGKWLRTHRPPNPDIGRSGVPEGPEALLRSGAWFMVGAGERRSTVGRPSVPLLVARPGGGRDTIGIAPDPSGLWIRGAGTFRRPAAHPLPPLHDVVPGGGSVVVAEWGRSVPEGAFSLRRFGTGGRLEREDLIRFPPVPLQDRVRDSTISAVADSVRAVVGRLAAAGIRDVPELPKDLSQAVRAELETRDAFPPIAALLAGLDGTVWVKRVLGPTSSEWIALDVDGRALLRVDLPEGASLAAASRETVWTTETDDLGTPSVVRYDLVESAGLD